MVPLYAAQVQDPGPEDVAVFKCGACGHTAELPPALAFERPVQGLGLNARGWTFSAARGVLQDDAESSRDHHKRKQRPKAPLPIGIKLRFRRSGGADASRQGQRGPRREGPASPAPEH
jgi:hypothetical protein